MADYTFNDLSRMQAQAAERVREMQKKSQNYTAESRRQSQTPGGGQPVSPPQNQAAAQTPGNPPHGSEHNNNSRGAPPSHFPGGKPQPGQHSQGEQKPIGAPPPGHKAEKHSSPLDGLLSMLPFDISGDRALILMILFMLRGENSDKLLMMALVYLAL